MKKILWAPGYIIISCMFFFPTESGKDRNVARSRRWWEHRHEIAPLISMAFYAAILFSIYSGIQYRKSHNNDSTVNSSSESPIKRSYQLEQSTSTPPASIQADSVIDSAKSDTAADDPFISSEQTAVTDSDETSTTTEIAERDKSDSEPTAETQDVSNPISLIPGH
jgi:hypothetical protein